jgi:toxin YoeB
MYPILLSKKAVKGLKLLRKENPKYAAKLWDLILDIFTNPFDGLGEPEALKNNLHGWWSRRITQEHRLVYRIKDDNLEIACCHGHYDEL